FKGMYKNIFGTEYEDGFTEAAKAMIPFSFKTAKKVGLKGGLITVPVAAGIGYAVDGEEGALIGAGSVIGAPALAAGTTVGALRSVFQHRYLTLAALFVYSNYLESANAKYEPVGFNVLSVTTPKLIGKGREFELSPELYDYFIALKKDKWLLGREDIERFHLVSPCKADITLVTTNCNCKIDSGDDLYQVNNGKGQIQLLKNSAKPDKEEFVYLWDRLDVKKREDIIKKCVNSIECAELMVANKELTEEFINYLHPIIIKAKEFMEDYPDAVTKVPPMLNMHFGQILRNSNEQDIMIKMHNDLKILDYQSVLMGIIINNPDFQSIKVIVDKYELEDIKKFNQFIRKYYIEKDLGEDVPFVEDFSVFTYNTLKSLYYVNENYHDFYAKDLKNPPYSDFFRKDKEPNKPSDVGDTIMWKLAREYDFHYRKITKDSNLDYAVKSCDYSEETTNPIDVIELLSGDENPITKEASVTAPCIIAKVDVDEGYKKTNEENYCYMGSHFRSNSIRTLIAAGNIAADAFITGVAGTGVGAVIALPLYVGTGVFAEWLDQLAIPDWPKRG
ncbi:MAG: hypothetical protein AABY14_04645, partial [Nanoarchaeota archaeon]